MYWGVGIMFATQGRGFCSSCNRCKGGYDSKEAQQFSDDEDDDVDKTRSSVVVSSEDADAAGPRARRLSYLPPNQQCRRAIGDKTALLRYIRSMSSAFAGVGSIDMVNIMERVYHLNRDCCDTGVATICCVDYLVTHLLNSQSRIAGVILSRVSNNI